MNKVILIGNIASAPETHMTQSGVSLSTFRLAVQRQFANTQGVREADFLTIVAWRQTADFCNKYLVKGRKVAVEGTLQNRSYDAQDGSKRWVTEIIAESVEALGGPQEKRDERPADAPNAAPQDDGFVEVEDDELPF